MKVLNKIHSWQQAGQKVVLVTGVFDLLHIEHLRFLAKAKAAGDKLVVGIESDVRVKRIKGHLRPLNSQTIRQEQLEHLRPVDLVFILPDHFDTQADWEKLMQLLHPNIYAVSSHTSYLDNKKAICEKFAIKFAIVHEFNAEYSTSQLHEKLLEL